MKTPDIKYPRQPAHLDEYVEVLGPALTVQFLTALAGADLYFPDDPKGKSRAERLIGADKLAQLARRLGNRVEVPIARTWRIHALRAQGVSTTEICRICQCSRRNVEKALKIKPDGSSQDPEPLPLFDHLG